MVYNGAHAACAYFGHPRGHRWIHEAAADEEVARRVAGMLEELTSVVRHHHGFSTRSMDAYRRDFWLRCGNQGLQDDVVRIGRQPKRKLGRWERLVAPAKLAERYGLPRGYMVEAILAALTFRHPDDPQSLELAAQLAQEGWRNTMSAVTGLDPSDPLLNEVEEARN
jgi:mannitol-1-phosphate 5-dehydrogenase